ncbi:MAG: response regulator [Chitinophagaceae bacterium]|nr:response regulator [Chitinophagaceae bacterium]
MLNKLLLVDDDDVTLTICRIVLSKAGFAKEIDIAKHGKQALDYFMTLKNTDDSAPVLILLDLNMPVMDGWDFLENYMKDYAEDFKETKIVILSSSINPEDFAKAKQYSIVVDFINKPLTIESVFALKHREALRQYFE